MRIVPVVSLLMLLLIGCKDSGPPLADDGGVLTPDASGDAAVCPQSGPSSPQPPADCPVPTYNCGFDDGGWSVQCKDGVVSDRDLTVAWFCPCNDGGHGGEVVCTLPYGSGFVARFTCPGACVDEEQHYFETPKEFSSFDQHSLCAAPDAGPPDAAP
jgi:hypothetical protein